MKILFTGASSFTGYWFVSALIHAGHEVVCPVRGAVDGYEGVRKQRVELLKKVCRFVPNAPFGGEAFTALALEDKWDVLCHHAADVTNYKSADFDVNRALLNNTLNLRSVLDTLKMRGAKGVILTGSVFENSEGLDGGSQRAFSPYGLSKGLTAEVFRFYCEEAQMRLCKFVIPNPFGPMEDPRFTAYLMKTWREGKQAGVKTPDYVRENIHVDLLAGVYCKNVERVTGQEGPFRVHPSEYIESQGAFALRVAREVKKRTGWACEVELAEQQDFSEPMIRTNYEPAVRKVKDWKESLAWDQFVQFYNGKA